MSDASMILLVGFIPTAVAGCMSLGVLTRLLWIARETR